MLPLVPSKRLRAKAITAIAALGIAAGAAAPAYAWGENEQNFLKGVAAAVIADRLFDEVRKANRAPKPQVQRNYVPAYAPGHAPRYAPANPAPYGGYSTSIYRTPAAQVFNSYSLTERRAIQRRLALQGYYRSSIDGSFGPGTYAAVTAFARDNGASRALETPNGAYSVYDGLIF